MALRRWFGWMSSASSHDSLWHVRLLTIVAVGIDLGLYKKRQDMPMFAPAAAWKPAPSEDDAGHPEVAEAKKVVTGASASRCSHEPAPPAAREPVQQEDREVKALRSKCRGALFLAA